MSEDVHVVLRGTSAGDPRRSLADQHYGINHRRFTPMMPTYKPKWGLVFFTRPQLNLSDENVIMNRRLAYLLDDNILSTNRAIRSVLDPRLHYRGQGSPIIDHKTAFISILSNMILNLSDPPDEVVPVHKSKKGLYGEEHSIVDGVFDNYSSYELSGTFLNPLTNSLKKLFDVWTLYMTSVFEGNMYPYHGQIIERRLDYNTRIYRITLTPDGKYVDEIFATGASFPLVNLHAFGYDATQGPYNRKLKEYQQRFECNGGIYNDPILVKQFNKVVETFNSDMKEENRPNRMVKLAYDSVVNNSSIIHFNTKGYPRINPDTMELEWWLDKEYFKTN